MPGFRVSPSGMGSQPPWAAISRYPAKHPAEFFVALVVVHLAVQERLQSSAASASSTSRTGSISTPRALANSFGSTLRGLSLPSLASATYSPSASVSRMSSLTRPTASLLDQYCSILLRVIQRPRAGYELLHAGGMSGFVTHLYKPFSIYPLTLTLSHQGRGDFKTLSSRGYSSFFITLPLRGSGLLCSLYPGCVTPSPAGGCCKRPLLVL